MFVQIVVLICSCLIVFLSFSLDFIMPEIVIAIAFLSFVSKIFDICPFMAVQIKLRMK